ncbi:MAG: hypothetical protein IKH01_00280 [Prevotella sp.]|nr:hypothetical protein [Prevotella sp.]MBR3078233.1 hypothetical protein [Prevotella sp.]
MFELSESQIDRIAQKTALILFRKLKDKENDPIPETCTLTEAAKILHVSKDHMRRIKDRFPHVKAGDSKQGRILFVRSALLEAYAK